MQNPLAPESAFLNPPGSAVNVVILMVGRCSQPTRPLRVGGVGSLIPTRAPRVQAVITPIPHSHPAFTEQLLLLTTGSNKTLFGRVKFQQRLRILALLGFTRGEN